MQRPSPDDTREAATAIPPGAFRLSLATAVVLSHFTRLQVGVAAVELFFVLSGFWIARMWERKYAAADRPALVFVASRFGRILPMFLLFNTVAILMHHAAHDGVGGFLPAARVLPNLIVLGYASMPAVALTPAWSLDIEAQFYLLFPLLLAGLVRWQRDWTVAGVALGAGALFLCVAWRSTVPVVLPYAGFFLLGIASARTGWRPTRGMARSGALAAAALFVALLAVPALRVVLIPGLDDARFAAWNTTLNVALACLLAPLALGTVRVRSGARDRLAGDLSYVVYCSHWLAVLVSASALHAMGRLERAPYVAALIAATYAGSLVVLLLIDRPISAWRERAISRHIAPKRLAASTP